MRIPTLFSSLLAGVLLVACQRPPTPNPEKPPVPKRCRVRCRNRWTAPRARRTKAMSRAMQEPLDRAKGAQKRWKRPPHANARPRPTRRSDLWGQSPCGARDPTPPTKTPGQGRAFSFVTAADQNPQKQ